jgi:L-alanine-DL-glutamate epimerase-like enolase superfamily enzyme
VTHGVETPVLADESVWDRHDLAAVIELRAADLVNIKLAKSGGPSHAHRVAALAAEAGMGVLVGCMLESPVGVAAAASFAAAIGRTNEVHDLDAGLWLKGSPVRGGVQYVNDTVVLPDLPGLGIAGLSDRDRSAA